MRELSRASNSGRREIGAGLAFRAWSRELLRELGLAHFQEMCRHMCRPGASPLVCPFLTHRAWAGVSVRVVVLGGLLSRWLATGRLRHRPRCRSFRNLGNDLACDA
jgi:hypothetical protein